MKNNPIPRCNFRHHAFAQRDNYKGAINQNDLSEQCWITGDDFVKKFIDMKKEISNPQYRCIFHVPETTELEHRNSFMEWPVDLREILPSLHLRQHLDAYGACQD